MARSGGLGLEAPARPATTAPASQARRRRGRCGPRCRVRPSRSRPSRTMPPPIRSRPPWRGSSDAAPRARPCLPEGEGLGVIVDEDSATAPRPGSCSSLARSGNLTPGGDVQRRHGGSARFHRAPCADSATCTDSLLLTSLLESAHRSVRPERRTALAVSDLRRAALVPDNDLRASIDEAHGELCAANVNGEADRRAVSRLLTCRRRSTGKEGAQLRLPKRERKRRRISESSSPTPERRAEPLRPPKRPESELPRPGARRSQQQTA